ncbi:MAG: hypothetical protein A3E80_02565 [Chlamydiae bacterium RIFCSPHIGHO2_12_FULL_49_9]|nr:MAG: hypothetical protein A3E80_02565 [Chlamydiae bacterium RIFCSPHIGHO2_12_FULL_49_9]
MWGQKGGEQLYRVLSPRGNPGLRIIRALLIALGVSLRFVYTARDSRIGSDCVGQPSNLRPVSIAQPFRLSCFDASYAWLKFEAPPCQLPILESLPV